ncbi:diadenosine tetraphosphate hydrolase [Candidatus Parcubacteria bacterium A4]|nr:MAG: diadenosine tetraphosphate hydrolase [Candidatus Parcubacteria bacterium A4]
MAIEKSAGAIVFRREKQNIYYLLLRYEAGHWDFPKGHIEKGEKIEETVRREIEEETGIRDIGFITGFKEWFKYFYKKDGKLVFKIVTFFLVETKTEEVKISPEHISYEWLDYEDALEQLTFKNAKEILEKAGSVISILR